jgi:DNA-binding SARP family transcriptional activator
MWFGLLGPLEVGDGPGGAAAPGGARPRVLLAALLVHANTPVPTETLAEAVWNCAPPPGAVRTLRSYIRRLRQTLGAQGATRIEAHHPGYLIRVAQSEVDVLEFEDSCRRASAALRAGAWAEAADAATRALGLWRADPLLDIPSQSLHDEIVPRLEQLRLQVLEDGAEAGLHLGQHERLIPRLRALTAEHPLRERFHAQFMLALARAGRQAEALTAYQRAYRTLADELGVKPGAELRSLHQRILAGDAETPAAPPPAALPARRPGRASPEPHPPETPRQLRAAVRHFVGRADELEALSALLAQRVCEGGATVSTIDGTAGIGKTALAVHWAQLHADRFPDGQLFVNLRGFDPAGAPMASGEAVRRFLVALGVPPEHIPADPEEQAALYRSRLAARRVLIVLDNARDAEQVRPLLPGSPDCLVLVTSRNQLGGLVALDGAVPLTLGLLTPDEARDLLTARLGKRSAGPDGRAADELIDLCARLPLALNIAAAHAALQPARPLSELVDELRDARRRLDTLSIGENAADVRTVFSWSYHALDQETARVFRLLGVHPGPDISLLAAASLTALEPEDTRRILDQLTRAHLLTEPHPGRYTFHDLLRAYALEQARIRDPQAEREAALQRVCDFYIHTAFAADHLLHPYRPPLKLEPPAPGVRIHAGRPSDVAGALAWFDAEHSNLLAAQRAAAAQRWHPAAWQLAWTLSTFHVRRGHRHDELAAWRIGLESAAHLPDPAADVRAHRLFGRAHTELGRHHEAIEQLHRALTLADRARILGEQALTHRTLAWAWERRGDARRALHHAAQALYLLRTTDEPVWEAGTLNQMGLYAARLGDYDNARAYCRAALAIYQGHDDPTGIADTALSLGYIEHHTGCHRQAIGHYGRALAVFRAIGNIYQSADILDHLGYPCAALGQSDRARAFWRQAVELYSQQGRIQEAERVQWQLDAL